MIQGDVVESHLTLENVQAENRELEIICVAMNGQGTAEDDISITTVGMCIYKYIYNLWFLYAVHASCE